MVKRVKGVVSTDKKTVYYVEEGSDKMKKAPVRGVVGAYDEYLGAYPKGKAYLQRNAKRRKELGLDYRDGNNEEWPG